MDFLDRIRTRAEQRRLGSYLGGRIGKGLCELQHDQVIANSDGATVRADINNALGSLFTLSSGATTPSTTIAYMLWADTTANLLKQRNSANSGWIVRGTLAETFLIARSSNTILAAADFGKTIVATSSFTQTLTAAATLGDGWMVYYRNDGTGVITLDPNSSETIDGATTIVLAPGESCVILCNGAAFKTIGRHDINTLEVDGTPDTAADYVATYDASAGRLKKVLLSGITGFATQAQQETASSTTLAVSPGRQQYHPSAAKAWFSAGTTGNALASYNISSITDNGVGVLTANWSVAFSGTNYSVVATANSTYAASAATSLYCMADGTSTTTCLVNIVRASDGNRADPAGSTFCAAFGDQ